MPSTIRIKHPDKDSVTLGSLQLEPEVPQVQLAPEGKGWTGLSAASLPRAGGIWLPCLQNANEQEAFFPTS